MEYRKQCLQLYNREKPGSVLLRAITNPQLKNDFSEDDEAIKYTRLRADNAGSLTEKPAKAFMKKINRENFKETLSKFTTGITVVTTNKDSFLYGKTINSFSSLSLSPPLVLFSIDIKSTKLNIFKNSKIVSINILSKNQKSISNNFAKKNPNWNEIEYSLLKNGNPIIKNCIANLDCKILEKIKKGDHIIFICKVLQVLKNNKLKPLIFFNSKYF